MVEEDMGGSMHHPILEDVEAMVAGKASFIDTYH